MAHWGEVPHFIRGKVAVARYIKRHIQPPLIDISVNLIPFAKPQPVHRDIRGRKVDLTVWIRQPRKFHIGWCRMAAKDPNWRVTYESNWIARRKALGLPYVIHNPASERKIA